ncbi:MAG TPA: IS110 family transposase [Acidimicrobiales bacterium]|nr:IS110 family transposase [Acidimicrobiales bacterium]
MKRGLPGVNTWVLVGTNTKEAPKDMLHLGLDLSRTRLDVCALDAAGSRVVVTASSPDADGLRHLAKEISAFGGPVRAAIESMNGARFVHDTLELCGWDVEIADAQKVKGLAPLACKTDKIDAFVLAELSRRDLVPAIWLPDPTIRAERERARFRLHLVRHRVMLKNRIHASLLAFGKPCPVTDLFGASGRELLCRLGLPDPWTKNIATALLMIDELEREIAACEAELRALGADHPYVSLLQSAPGIAWVLGFTIASEIGDIERFSSPKKLVGYTGLCPRVHQSGGKDFRGPLSKNGPKYLRWALIEGATHASRNAIYKEHYEKTKARLGPQRGTKVARVEVARKLAEAIWHMLTTGATFAPARSHMSLAA